MLAVPITKNSQVLYQSITKLIQQVITAIATMEKENKQQKAGFECLKKQHDKAEVEKSNKR